MSIQFISEKVLIMNDFVEIKEKRLVVDNKYELRFERSDLVDVELCCAYTLNGDYIGTEEEAEWLINEKGIAPVKRHPDHKRCSIGFCENEQKWYGWSHRAIFGFGIGDEVKKGSILGRTGSTGLAVGDHLHFGVYVHGIPVRPLEWWDPKWINEKIEGRIDTAKSEYGE